jgi:hypothetical protein
MKLDNLLKFNRKISVFFYLITLITSLSITLFISAEATGLISTIDSFVFPNSFIKKDFNTTEPWIEYSFLIRNNHHNVIDTVSFRAEIDFEYVTRNNSTKREPIFENNKVFHSILPDAVLHDSTNYTKEHFLMDNLNEIWGDIIASEPYTFFITIHIKGIFFGNLVKFAMTFRDINLTRYEFPY